MASGTKNKFRDRLREVIRRNRKRRKKDKENEDLGTERLDTLSLSNTRINKRRIYIGIFKQLAILPFGVFFTSFKTKKSSAEARKDIVDAKTKEQIKNRIPIIDLAVPSDKKKQEEIASINEINRLKVDVFNYVNDLAKKEGYNLDFIQSELDVLNHIISDPDSLEECKQNRLVLAKVKKEIGEMTKDTDIIDEKNKQKMDMDVTNINIMSEEELLEVFKKLNDNKGLLKDYPNVLKTYEAYVELKKVKENNQILDQKIVDKKNSPQFDKENYERVKKQIIDKTVDSKNKIALIESEIKKYLALSDKLSQISSEERVSYELKGLSDIITTSLVNITSYMVIPLLGFFPGILLSSVTTRKMMTTIRRGVHLQRNVDTVYHADDYTSEIGSSLDKIMTNRTIINGALEDIIALRLDLVSKFSKYSDQIPEYSSILDKISVMEEMIISTRERYDLMEEKMRTGLRTNQNTLVRVRSLNKD